MDNYNYELLNKTTGEVIRTYGTNNVHHLYNRMVQERREHKCYHLILRDKQGNVVEEYNDNTVSLDELSALLNFHLVMHDLCRIDVDYKSKKTRVIIDGVEYHREVTVDEVVEPCYLNCTHAGTPCRVLAIENVGMFLDGSDKSEYSLVLSHTFNDFDERLNEQEEPEIDEYGSDTWFAEGEEAYGKH